MITDTSSHCTPECRYQSFEGKCPGPSSRSVSSSQLASISPSNFSNKYMLLSSEDKSSFRNPQSPMRKPIGVHTPTGRTTDYKHKMQIIALLKVSRIASVLCR